MALKIFEIGQVLRLCSLSRPCVAHLLRDSDEGKRRRRGTDPQTGSPATLCAYVRRLAPSIIVEIKLRYLLCKYIKILDQGELDNAFSPLRSSWCQVSNIS